MSGPEQIQFTTACLGHWAGMGDYLLLPPDRSYELTLQYKGEALRGDSYHSAWLDGRQIPGYAWGGVFAISECSSYIAFGWMADRFDRRTMIVDSKRRTYFILPRYISKPKIKWPTIMDESTLQREAYTFNGTEVWAPL